MWGQQSSGVGAHRPHPGGPHIPRPRRLLLLLLLRLLQDLLLLAAIKDRVLQKQPQNHKSVL